MRKYLPHIFIISFAFFLTPAVSLADADRIFKLNNKAVVVVVAYDEKGNAISQGSGFIVRRDGAVVTNYHVISKARSIKVKAGDKVFDVEGLIFTDKENDLVILKAKAKDMPIVKLGVIEKANIGEHIYVISSPVGLENTISDGLLSGIREIDEKRKILQITAPVSPGSSGGPVFNRNGEVIGVVTMLIKEAQNLNFAMPVKLIKDKISSKSVTEIKGSGVEDYEMTAEYWFYLGIAHADLGKHEESVESFKQAIRLDPDCKEAHHNLGIAYAKSGRYEEAIESLKQAIRLYPDFAWAHYSLGSAYGKSGKYKEAIESYKQAIRLKPDFAKAHYSLGLAYFKSGKYQEAIKSYKRAIRLDPDDKSAHYNLGIAYFESGMNKEAIESFKQAIKINPDDARAHFLLGATCLILNDKGSALEQYKILKKLDTEMANVLFNLIYSE